jgi:hypothetical protein
MNMENEAEQVLFYEKLDLIGSRMVENNETGEQLVAVKTNKSFLSKQIEPLRAEGARVYCLLDKVLLRELIKDKDLIEAGLVKFIDMNEPIIDQEDKMTKKYVVVK